MARDSIVDAISFIRRIVLWSKNKFSGSSSGWIWVPISLIWPGPAPARYEIVKSGAALKYTTAHHTEFV